MKKSVGIIFAVLLLGAYSQGTLLFHPYYQAPPSSIPTGKSEIQQQAYPSSLGYPQAYPQGYPQQFSYIQGGIPQPSYFLSHPGQQPQTPNATAVPSASPPSSPPASPLASPLASGPASPYAAPLYFLAPPTASIAPSASLSVKQVAITQSKIPDFPKVLIAADYNYFTQVICAKIDATFAEILYEKAKWKDSASSPVRSSVIEQLKFYKQEQNALITLAQRLKELLNISGNSLTFFAKSSLKSQCSRCKSKASNSNMEVLKFLNSHSGNAIALSK